MITLGIDGKIDKSQPHVFLFSFHLESVQATFLLNKNQTTYIKFNT